MLLPFAIPIPPYVELGRSAVAADSRVTIGWVEYALLSVSGPAGSQVRLPIEAKVDTGAKTSSLHALDIRRIERGGQVFLRFRIPLPGKMVEAEAPLVKRAAVKSSEGNKDDRYFIEASLCLGGIQTSLTFSLNDRSQMKYPILLGRSFLSEKFLVDSSRKFVLDKPKCQ